MYEKLEKEGMHAYFKENRHNSSDPDDYLAIDFKVRKDDEELASVWGSTKDDVDWECDHSEILWGDDDEQGECLVCGAVCDWHWVKDVVSEGHDEDGNYTCTTGETREIIDFYRPTHPEGFIKYVLDKYCK